MQSILTQAKLNDILHHTVMRKPQWHLFLYRSQLLQSCVGSVMLLNGLSSQHFGLHSTPSAVVHLLPIPVFVPVCTC